MKGPGIAPGVRIKQQVRTIDVLPTVVDLMGSLPPTECQGISVMPALSGKAVPLRTSYGETLYPKLNMGWAELRAIRTDRWKYIQAPRPELYDLANDPGETTNIIDQRPVELHELEEALKRVTPTPDGKPENVDTSMVDQRTMEQLKSLGYLSGFAGGQYELTGKGPDPKDRIAVLKIYETVEAPGSKLPVARRIEMLQRALADDAGNPSTYLYLGGELEKTGRYNAAMKLYQTASLNGIQNGKLYSRIADLYLRSGRKEEALPFYEKAAQYNPSDVESQSKLATAYLAKGRVEDAERVYKWIVTTDESQAAAYNGLGLISIQRQDPATARGYFEKAAQLDPDLVEAQLKLGLIYKMAGERERARACFETFLAKASRTQYAQVIPKVREELIDLQ
jgi:tetratricopeptide (TPR) repeat protein